MENFAEAIKLLFQIAQDTPDKIAFVDGERGNTTISALLHKASGVASLLRSKGIGKDKFIPIVLPNSADYISAEIGIWMTGNAAVHLGTSFPQERIDFIREDCEAPIIIDKSCIEEISDFDFPGTVENRLPSQPCALFYTSGSTGKPKGVLHSDKSFLDGVTRLDIGKIKEKDDVYGCIAPFYFIAVTKIYNCLLNGYAIYLVGDQAKKDINSLQNYFRENKITTTFLSPSVLRHFDATGTSLRVVFTGSERVSDIFSKDFRIEVKYGQTETASAVLSFVIDKPYSNTPIGKPIPGLEAIVIDENGNEVQMGDIGELCLKGITPCEYFKDKQKTENLLRNGLFHTGDLVKQLPSGDFLFFDRMDWMIKVNGQRVDPSEVEATINKMPGVKRSVVKGFTSQQTNRQYLCAFYTSAEDISEEEMRTFVGKSLPEYMIPAYFERVEDFPLNANGKIDRTKLQMSTESVSHANYVAPTNNIEALLCNCMQQTLGITQVGIDDDFVRLGGDSIRIMALQKKFNESKPADYKGILSNKIINEGRTPRKIATLLNSNNDIELESQEDYPLNDMQKFYFLISSLKPKAPIGNLPMLYKLSESVDLEKLSKAIEKAVNNHLAFKIRLRYDKKDSWWKDLILRNRLLTICGLLLNGVKIRQRAADSFIYHQAIEEMKESDLLKDVHKLIVPYKLIDSPLFRIRLIRTEKAPYLFIDMNHIIFDGGSKDVFFNDIEKAYQGEDLEPEKWTILHAVTAEKKFQQSEYNLKARDWYKEQFKDVNWGVFPKPDLNGTKKNFKVKSLRLSLSEQKIKELAKNKSCSVNVLVTSAFAFLLGKTVGNINHVPLCLAYNAREDYRTDNTIGMLSRGIFLNASWSDNMSINDYIDGIGKYILKGMDNCFLSMDSFKKVGIKIQKVMPFLYQGERTMSPIIGGNPSQIIDISPNPKDGMPMAVHFFITDGQPELMVFYNSDLYSDRFVERFIGDYTKVLHGFANCNFLDEIKLDIR